MRRYCLLPFVLLLDLTVTAQTVSFFAAGPPTTWTAAPGSASYGVEFGTPALGDYDNDGLLDLVTASEATSVPVLLLFRGTPGGGFTSALTIPTGVSGTGCFQFRLFPIDADHDGNLDLLVTRSVWGAYVFRGNGLGGFTLVPGALGTYFIDAVVGDVTGDGWDDVVSIEDTCFSIFGPPPQPPGPIALRVYPGGPNAFAPGPVLGLNDVYSDLGIIDVDGDGRKDVVARVLLTTTFVEVASVWRSLPGGSFAAPAPTTITAFPDKLVAGDFNGDGRGDAVVFSSFPGSLEFFAGTAAGSFAAPVTVTPAVLGTVSFGSFVAGTDVDRDGNLDLLSLASTGFPTYTTELTVNRGIGTGGFRSAETTSVGTSSCAGFFANGDLDLDGDPDAVAVDATNCVFQSAAPLNIRTQAFINRAVYGTGCPGAAGIPPIQVGSATPGNGSFAVSLSNVPAGALTLLGLSLAPAAGSSIPCALAIDFSQLLALPGSFNGLLLLPADANGGVTQGLPIPSTPSLSGTVLFLQWAAVDPAASFNLPGINLSLSRGQTFIIW